MSIIFSPQKILNERIYRRQRGERLFRALPGDIRNYLLRCIEPSPGFYDDDGKAAAAELLSRWIDTLDGPAFWEMVMQANGAGDGTKE